MRTFKIDSAIKHGRVYIEFDFHQHTTLQEKKTMNSTSSKIAIACATGGSIGSFVAHTFNPRFWWVGMIIGGLIGYLTFEIKETILAIPRTYRKVTSWHPDWEFWRYLFEGYFYTLTVSSWFWGYYLYSNDIASDKSVTVFVVTSLALIIPLIVASGRNTPVIIDGHQLPKDADLKILRKIFKYGNPVSFPFVLLALALFLAVWIVRQLLLWTVEATFWANDLDVTPAFQWVGKFLWTFFVMIHKEERLICMVDATLGVALSFFFVSSTFLGVIVGGLIGAILGVINYEIVSVRWLKIVPSRS